MTTLAAATRRPTAVSAALAVAITAVLAGLGNTLISLLARAAGASDSFRPLQPGTYLGLTVVGTIAGVVGWLVVRRTSRPRATLQRLVPAVVLLSWIPDLLLGATQFQPHTTWTGVIGLMAMHLVVTGIAVPTFARLLPLDR